MSQKYNLPVRVEEISFNIIPEKDLVPRIDDVAQNFQNIRCTLESPNILLCHAPMRSLCELLYTCGSGPRPVLCECHILYGYPEPFKRYNSNSSKTFAEECANVFITP